MTTQQRIFNRATDELRKDRMLRCRIDDIALKLYFPHSENTRAIDKARKENLDKPIRGGYIEF